jgi:hypothetical protein
MFSTSKFISVAACSAVLGLSLATAAQARMSTGPCPERISGQPSLLVCDIDKQQGIDTIKGEVLRVTGGTIVIEQFNGREVRLHPDANVGMTEVFFHQGDWIEAKVKEENDQRQVLSVHHLNNASE